LGALDAVPVLFQNPPATLHPIVFAVVRRVAQQLDGLTDVIGEFDYAVEKLRHLQKLRTVVRIMI